MRIDRIQVSNFRSLRNLEVNLEKYLSVVVGKNNSGKTSLLLALERFLGSVTPGFDDVLPVLLPLRRRVRRDHA